MIPREFSLPRATRSPGETLSRLSRAGSLCYATCRKCPPPEHPILRPRPAPICRFTSMVNLNNRQELPDAPVMHIVDGKAVEPRAYNWLERIFRFLLRPFVEAWHHRDLIAAILRRELR